MDAVSAVDAWIEATQIYDDIPGISVGVVVDQEVVFTKGYGYANRRRKSEASADTIYSVCSISKLFTSIAVMQMRDAGKLTLRDPISDHLSWVNIKQKHLEAGPARVLGLLTHSSGLPRESDFNYWRDDFPFPDRQSMINRLADQETLYPADSLFQYSNLGLTLAGEIVAAHAQTSYEDYVQNAILAPLGLGDTRPYLPRNLHGKQMAIGYSGKFRDRKRTPVKPFDTQVIAAAAGYTSSVNDLARFASWQFRTLKGEDNSVLSGNTLREMHRVHWVDPDWKTSWGIGFNVRNHDGTTVVGHSGGCPGYITNFSMVPKLKLAVIALTNASDGPAVGITTGMLNTIGPAVKKASKAKSTEGKQESGPIERPDLSEYEGNYGGTVWGREAALRQWGDKLVVLRLPARTLDTGMKLKQVEGDTFIRLTKDGEERERWNFARDDAGRVTGFTRHSMFTPKL